MAYSHMQNAEPPGEVLNRLLLDAERITGDRYRLIEDAQEAGNMADDAFSRYFENDPPATILRGYLVGCHELN